MQFIHFGSLQGLSERLVGLGLLHSLWISLLVASLVCAGVSVSSSDVAPFALCDSAVVTLFCDDGAFSGPAPAPCSEVTTVGKRSGESRDLRWGGDRLDAARL